MWGNIDLKLAFNSIKICCSLIDGRSRNIVLLPDETNL